MNIDFTPQQINEWTATLWSIGWKGLLVFSVIYYRDLVTKIIGTVVEIIGSWLKRR